MWSHPCAIDLMKFCCQFAQMLHRPMTQTCVCGSFKVDVTCVTNTKNAVKKFFFFLNMMQASQTLLFLVGLLVDDALSLRLQMASV